jgi:hypothetical protein
MPAFFPIANRTINATTAIIEILMTFFLFI